MLPAGGDHPVWTCLLLQTLQSAACTLPCVPQGDPAAATSVHRRLGFALAACCTPAALCQHCTRVFSADICTAQLRTALPTVLLSYWQERLHSALMLAQVL